MNQEALAAISRADGMLKATLSVLGLPVRGSYSAAEVCSILGISDRTFRRLVKACERDQAGRLKVNNCLDSFMLGTHHRVTYAELAGFLQRNNKIEREAV